MLSILSIVAIAPLFSSIGERLGRAMFIKKDLTYHDAKHTFRGDLYYDGRTTIHFYDNDLKRIIILQKKDLKR